MKWLGDKVKEASLRWFGPVQRKDRGVCWTKDAEYGADRQEETRKTIEKIHGVKEGIQRIM